MPINNSRYLRLINDCAKQLLPDSGANGLATVRHLPSYPFINVFWPGLPENAEELIRGIYDEMWNAAAHSDNLSPSLSASLDSEAIRSFIGEAADDLRQTDLLQHYNFFMVAHYINMSAPDFEQQLDALCDVHGEKLVEAANAPLPSFYPFVFFFADRATRNHVQKIKLAQEKLAPIPNSCGIYLSTRLTDGSLLSAARESENFRIAADIMILACTRKSNDYSKGPIFSELSQKRSVTVGYRVIEKPLREIAVVTLHEIVRKKIAEAEANKQAHINDRVSAPSFFNGITSGSGNQIEFVEDFFKREVLPTFPAESTIAFLPNWSRAQKASSLMEANNLTDDFLRLFTLRYFSAGDIDLQVLKQGFISCLINKYDYKFARDLNICSSHLDNFQPPAGGGSIYAQMVALGRKDLYEKAIPAFKEAMTEYADSAREYDEFISDIQARLFGFAFSNQEGLRPIDEYYGSRASTYLGGEMTSLLRPELNGSEEDYYSALYEAFVKLTSKAPEVYKMTMEKDRDERMEADVNGRKVSLSSELVSADLRGEARIGMQWPSLLNDILEYYLLYKGATYADAVNAAVKMNTNSQHRAERLVIIPMDAIPQA